MASTSCSWSYTIEVGTKYTSGPSISSTASAMYRKIPNTGGRSLPVLVRPPSMDHVMLAWSCTSCAAYARKTKR